MKDVNKIDKRVSKTKSSLKSALVTLLSNKKIEDITVIELTQAASLNRKTFYLHYKDVESILREIENELISKLKTRLSEITLSSSTFPNFVFAGFDTIIQDEFALKVFSQTSYTRNIIKIMDKIYIELMYTYLKNKYPSADARKILSIVQYHSWGSMRLLLNWVKDTNKTMDLLEFSSFVASLITDSIQDVTENSCCND